jgi:signal transduction histidine kinase
MLTATVSHDMRTPLNSIMGIGKNLEPFVKDKNGAKYLSIMMNSARLLNFLVNDLIDLFRIRNGKFSIFMSKVDLKAHLTELLEIFSV